MTQAIEGIALRTGNESDRIALRGVRVRSLLRGMSQRTTVEQTFVNLEPRAIEAVYTFPLPESAAVCGFEVVTADRVLTGQIEEAEQATEQYEQAIDRGDGAFIMEQDRPDVFTVRVGNLKPRQAATIRLTYVCALEKVDRQIRLAFPTTIAPRYATATASDPVEAMFDGEALNPPHVLAVPYGLSMDLDIDLGRDVQAVTSPSHAIEVRQGEAGRAHVSFAAGLAEMNRDVVLQIALAKEHEPAVQVARGKRGESYLAVTFLPEFSPEDAEPQPVETVFLLDCSGSMMGESIAQAKAALELCLRSLSAGDTFNICRFGSTFELMSSEPLPYTQQTLERAIRYVRETGDLGGTELHPPLEAILKTKPRAGTVRQVIVLTDGQVTNEPAVVELARKHRAANRIFSFGIGSACSQFLVKGIARATGGAAEFITAGERIDDKVLRTFSRMASPMVSDVSIDWDDCEVQTLAELPAVFDGDVMAIYARAPGRAPKQVTLKCTTPAGERKWSVAVPAAIEDEGVIGTMWARRTIQSMEEVNGPVALRTRASKPTREQAMLISISKEFNVLCSLTTFLAVEHRSLEDRNEGRPAVRRVPVQIAQGWGDISDMTLSGAMPCMAPMAAGAGAVAYAAPPPMRKRMPPPAAPAPAQGRAVGGLFRRMLRSLDKSVGSGPADQDPAWDAAEQFRGGPPAFGAPARAEEMAEAKPPADSVGSILSLQCADGSFAWNAAADQLVLAGGHNLDAWRKAITDSLPTPPSREVMHTVLALLALRILFAADQQLWLRAYQKAIRQVLGGVLGMSRREAEQWLADVQAKVRES